MKLNHLAGALSARLACILAIAMMAGVAIVPASAAAEESTGPVGIGIVPTEEVEDEGKVDPPPTEPVPTEPIPTEPVPTEESSEEQLPPDTTPTEESTPQEGSGREDEAVAPGFVVLVIFTSDGNPTSDGTFACVGAVCQPAGGLASGTKLLFPDIDSGWNDVTVDTGFRSGNASTSVNVAAGQGSHVELTLVSPVGGIRDSPDPTPPPVSATGPLRTAPGRADSEEQPPWSTNSNLVSSMPVTGAASSASSTAAPLMIAGALVLASIGCGLAARWTGKSRAG